MGPSPAVAAVRTAVRTALHDLPAGALVLVGCSGGADSVALAAALAFEAPRHKGGALRAGGVSVDHGLQPGSADRAAGVVRLMRGLGLDPAEAITVDVGREGGPEAAARAARYGALDAAAARLGAAAILLGHTRDDQAETVLLGLARGSGLRSLSGMPANGGPGPLYRRPLLDVPRVTTARACADADLPVWNDPHNADPAYARARVRADVMPAAEKALGPGVAEALARTAGLARDDADALDGWAAEALVQSSTDDDGLDAAMLATLPIAVRRRVLRLAALGAGASPGSLGAVHLHALEALVSHWHGQGPVDLPGGAAAVRSYGRLYFRDSRGSRDSRESRDRGQRGDLGAS